MAINGNKIFISFAGSTTPIACTKSNEINTEADLIEVSSPVSGNWKDYIPGRKTWSVTVNFLLAASSAVSGVKLADALNIGNTYTLDIYERGSSTTKKLTGTAILKVCRITATRGNLTQGTFQFVGKSELAVPAT